MVRESQPTVKKPYTPPQLLIYGDIRMITQNSGSSTTGDNAGKANHKSAGA
jgi:hypothetical protein